MRVRGGVREGKQKAVIVLAGILMIGSAGPARAVNIQEWIMIKGRLKGWRKRKDKMKLAIEKINCYPYVNNNSSFLYILSNIH
jgi:hypothetical protein